MKKLIIFIVLFLIFEPIFAIDVTIPRKKIMKVIVIGEKNGAILFENSTIDYGGPISISTNDSDDFFIFVAGQGILRFSSNFDYKTENKGIYGYMIAVSDKWIIVAQNSSLVQSINLLKINEKAIVQIDTKVIYEVNNRFQQAVIDNNYIYCSAFQSPLFLLSAMKE